MRIRSLALFGATCALVLSFAPTAMAAGPQTGPATMQSVTFEGLSDTLTNFDYLYLFNVYSPPPATWGIVNGSGVGGSGGLWVAGSVPTVYPTYPVGTRGEAELYVGDATHDYSSQIQFSYIEPSLGSNDRIATQKPFIVNWGATATAGATGYSDWALPLTSSWVTITRTRGAAGNNPPRSAGYLRFQFVSDPTQTSGGAGVRIDNVKVIGFKYGPARNVAVKRQPGNLTSAVVTWDKPYAADTPGTADPRSIYYRVFRRDLAANTWAEVTTDATSATTFTDAGAMIGKTYEYAVQGYDSATDASHWGVPATSGQVGPGYPHFMGTVASAATVPYGSTVVVRATMLDPEDVPASGLATAAVLERSFDGLNFSVLPAAVGESPAGTYAANVVVQANAWYRFRYAANGVAGAPVRIASGTYLTTPSTPSKVKRSAKFTVKGSASRAPLASRTVVLRTYRKVNSRTWALKSTVRVKVGAGLGVVAYKTTLKLTKKGTYRVSATVSDGYSAAITTGYRTFVVK